MSLISEAERILAEEAARVVAIGQGGSQGSSAARNGGAAGGGALGGLIGGPIGAALGAGAGRALGDAAYEWLTGASSDAQREMRQAARRAAGKIAEVLGREMRAEIDRRGLGSFYAAIANGASVVPWSEYVANGDVRDLRGVPRGEGQRAARIYMDAAAPGARVGVPSRITGSDAWQVLTRAWGDFSMVVGRFVAVMDAFDKRGLPDPPAGARALMQAYPRQWAQFEASSGGPIFGSTGLSAQEAPALVDPSKVPIWPSEGMPQGLQSLDPTTGKPWIATDGWADMTEAQKVAWLTARGLPSEYAYADGEARYRARVGAAGAGAGAKNTKRSGGLMLPIVGVLTTAGISAAAAISRAKRSTRKGGKSRKGRRR